MLIEFFLVLRHIWAYLTIIGLLTFIGFQKTRTVKTAWEVLMTGSLAIVLVCAIFWKWHTAGLAQVVDLRQHFEVAAQDNPAGWAVMGQLDQIILERNRRLRRVGLCSDGDWWIAKETGELPRVSTNSVYYFCGRYGE